MRKQTAHKGQPIDWWTVKPTPLTQKYESFFDELYAPDLESGVPFSEASWGERFTHACNKPIWKIKKDYPGNPLAVDLIEMAHRFFPIGSNKSLGAAFGGAGVDSSQIWIPALDGGVFLEFLVMEHPRTNELSAHQTTIIGGSECFRFLLRKLGFKSVPRKLKGEISVPSEEDSERLRTEQISEGTEAHRLLAEAASNPPEFWLNEF